MSATNSWLRLWHDMPNDPKWRTIARVSKQPPALVIAVYLHVLVDASTNATERGRTQSLCVEDVATALDVDDEQVQAILDAMQGRVMDGDMVSGWEKRQPKREDGSAKRAKEWRERQKQQKNDKTNACKTQPNATERIPNAEKRPDADADKSNTPLPPKRGVVDELFDQFWSAYPRKVGKGVAKKRFKALKPDDELVQQMLSALDWQSETEQWRRDGGRYIPNPGTWLNQERWLDGESAIASNGVGVAFT